MACCNSKIPCSSGAPQFFYVLAQFPEFQIWLCRIRRNDKIITDFPGHVTMMTSQWRRELPVHPEVPNGGNQLKHHFKALQFKTLFIHNITVSVSNSVQPLLPDITDTMFKFWLHIIYIETSRSRFLNSSSIMCPYSNTEMFQTFGPHYAYISAAMQIYDPNQYIKSAILLKRFEWNPVKSLHSHPHAIKETGPSGHQLKIGNSAFLLFGRGSLERLGLNFCL